MAYFQDERLNRKTYVEIKAGLERVKRAEIEEVLTGDDYHLDTIIDNVASIVENCEDAKRLFRSYIFDDVIPEDMLAQPDEDDILEDIDEDEEEFEEEEPEDN